MGSVKVVDFTVFGQRFQAISAGPHHEFNDAISIVVLCDDQAELDRYWNALLAGGGKPQGCGWLIDSSDSNRLKRNSEQMIEQLRREIAAPSARGSSRLDG